MYEIRKIYINNIYCIVLYYEALYRFKIQDSKTFIRHKSISYCIKTINIDKPIIAPLKAD